MPSTRTRFQLLMLAEIQMARLRTYPPDPSTAQTLALLTEIVVDGQPTPQVTRNPAGGIEVGWLVNNHYAALMVDEDGYQMWAEEPSGREVFAHETLSRRPDPRHGEYVQRLRDYLVELGEGVDHE